MRAGTRLTLQYLGVAVIPIASLLVCSCATPYQPLDNHYGHSERQISNDVYEVSFRGNGHCSYDRVVDFAMLRAAEIALNHHARSFILLDLVSLSSLRRYQVPSEFYSTAGPHVSTGPQPVLPAAGLFDGVNWSYLMLEPAREATYYRPGVKLTVKLLPDPPGSYYPYDPAKEIERLRSKYGVKSANGNR